jgi:hypothetical protein
MAGADASITEALDKASDQELKKIMMEARDLARTQRPTIEKQFREKYTTEVRKATNKAKKIAASLADISLGELSLVDDDDLNETLKYNAVAAKIKRKCEEELSAVDQRVRVLLDDPNLESDDNPSGRSSSATRSSTPAARPGAPCRRAWCSSGFSRTACPRRPPRATRR